MIARLVMQSHLWLLLLLLLWRHLEFASIVAFVYTSNMTFWER